MPSRTAHGGYFRLDTAQKPKDQILPTASPHTCGSSLVAGGTRRLVAVTLQRQQNLTHASEI